MRVREEKETNGEKKEKKEKKTDTEKLLDEMGIVYKVEYKSFDELKRTIPFSQTIRESRIGKEEEKEESEKAKEEYS